MATVQYSSSSPYSLTQIFDKYLDVATFPEIPKRVDDVLFQVNRIYQFRPDLLSFDLYGSADFWWVFALRNPNVLKDPIFDMKPGIAIYIPKKDVITSLVR